MSMNNKTIPSLFLVVDHCFENNTCSENGQCVTPPGANEVECECNSGFTGNICECE